MSEFCVLHGSIPDSEVYESGGTKVHRFAPLHTLLGDPAPQEADGGVIPGLDRIPGEQIPGLDIRYEGGRSDRDAGEVGARGRSHGGTPGDR